MLKKLQKLAAFSGLPVTKTEPGKPANLHLQCNHLQRLTQHSTVPATKNLQEVALPLPLDFDFDADADADADCWTAPAADFEKHMLLGRSLKLLVFKLGCVIPVVLLTNAKVVVGDSRHNCSPQQCKGLD